MSLNICQSCGRPKKSYATRADARRDARLIPGRKIRVYRCGCYWHLTSVPADRASALRERGTA